ncbi:MAG: PepSY domain-containing protein [Formivibrio sp.]|nr:PepSY domain-containing protein [Formivibrio sp.]
MLNKKMITPLIKIHRWLALFLAPVFLLILISGAILAFKPIVQSGSAAALNVPALITSLNKVDPQGQAGMLSVASDGNSFELRSRGAGPNGTFDVVTAAPVQASGFNLFDFALRLHKSLLIGAGGLVEMATYVMVGLVFSGLLMGRPKLRNTVSGWHAGLGWLGLPLVVITPVTGLLMALHLGMPSLPVYESADQPLPIVRTLEIASQQVDLSHLTQARSFRRGAVMLSTGSATHIVSGSGQLTTSTQGPGWVRMLHEGTWAGAWSGLFSLLSALSLIGLLATGVWGWWRRRRQSQVRSAPSADPANSTLVAYASQTGTAAKLAEATVQALRAAGESAMLVSLAALRPDELVGFGRTLLIASTTGEGELPDPAKAFMQKLSATGVQGSRFSLLALGDKRYSEFCGGGLKLRAALLKQGAEEILPVETVDGDVAARWQSWLGKVGKHLGVKNLASQVLTLDQPVRLRLAVRARLDNPQEKDLQPTWHLRFKPVEPNVVFRPGDLLLISPARDVPARCYSIGSSSLAGDGLIDLTVALHSKTNVEGQIVLGLASNYLCQQLEMGGEITAQLRKHPDFNPPSDPCRPIILIATGAGIAPFPGFLSERKSVPNAGPVWLFFGNRKPQGDFYHRDFFEACREQGVLTWLDTAFSREENGGGYIQNRILAQGPELLRWMNENNALIYVCGRSSTLGIAVESALLNVLASHPDVQRESPEEILARWKADGRLKLDLFA